LLSEHLPELVDYKFTAAMEDELDAISRGEMNHVDYLRTFYFGKDTPGLKQLLADKVGEIDARNVCSIPLGTPEGGAAIFVRVGRYGPFLEQGERRASLPEGLAPDELTLDMAVEMLEKSQQGEEPLGICPDTHKPVFIKIGRFGPYVQRGTPEDDEKPQNASLLKGMTPEDVTLEVAIKLLTLPRTLGNHPENNEPVVAFNGRFGPYVKCGEETRSLPGECSPLDVTLEQALALLAQPKVSRGGGVGRAKEPLKTFEASPVTTQPIRLLEGRYGPYLTDGETNCSLPRSMTVEEVTFDTAVTLLKERAAAGPSKKAARKKKAAPKAAKKTAKPKAAKTAKKKAAKKTAKKTVRKAAKKKTAP
jgi:DNA topoisomerase I